MWDTYWNQFLKKTSNGSKKRDGIAFEQLIQSLLQAKYGMKWHCTKQSHDNNHDLWLLDNEEHIWAECKNYSNTIAMNILAPTLVMAQVYDVNTILFFSRSIINQSSKKKIIAFGEKANKRIFFYDGEILEQLILKFSDKLPMKYRPLQECNSAASLQPIAKLYFSQDPISGATQLDDRFLRYDSAMLVRYNETFGLSFVLENKLPDEALDVKICFSDVQSDRFCFEYFSKNISSDKPDVFYGTIEPGEGVSISINARPIVFKAKLKLPGFRISFSSGKRVVLEQMFNPVVVICKWVGQTKLIGSKYHTILNDVEENLLGNYALSCFTLIGSSGTGKSRLISECLNILLKHGYAALDFSAFIGLPSYRFLREIVAFIYEIPDSQIIEHLENQYCTTQDGDINDVPVALQLIREIDNLREESTLFEFIDQQGEILFEKIAQMRCALIIDNIQYVGSAFLYFIRKLIQYSVNRARPTLCSIFCVINQDFISSSTSDFLFEIVHANIKHLLSYRINGFETDHIGLLFLRELIHTNNPNLDYLFKKIIDKVSLNPYYLHQTVCYLEESNLIRKSPSGQGYLIESDGVWKVVNGLSNGIIEVLDRRWSFLVQKVIETKMCHICSVIYLFDRINIGLRNIFNISEDDLTLLVNHHFLQKNDEEYSFDHDILRSYFSEFQKKHIFDCLKWLEDQQRSNRIIGYYSVNMIYQIAIKRNIAYAIDILETLNTLQLPPKTAFSFLESLFDITLSIPENLNNNSLWIEYLNDICKQIRKYKGSTAALDFYEQANSSIKHRLGRKVYSDYISTYRPFLHFYCDILVELHRQNEARDLIKAVISEASKIDDSIGTEAMDENLVLRAIMYNRWYITFNNVIPTEEIKVTRKRLLQQSRQLANSIKSPEKKRLIQYLNDSDEGYNYYGYWRDKNMLLSIWNCCLTDMPNAAPEKTLNYYRKLIQYDLINQDFELVVQHLEDGRNYLEIGKYSHEPSIFNTFFLMAECMAFLQNSPLKSIEYVNRLISDLLQLQQMLQNGKLGDIMLLKGVNAFYSNDADGVYYSFSMAYRDYLKKNTSRYWIKLNLLIENIHYAFTILDVYSKGYDCSFLPNEVNEPMCDRMLEKHRCSGVQRTKDRLMNLPLI